VKNIRALNVGYIVWSMIGTAKRAILAASRRSVCDAGSAAGKSINASVPANIYERYMRTKDIQSGVLNI